MGSESFPATLHFPFFGGIITTSFSCSHFYYYVYAKSLCPRSFFFSVFSLPVEAGRNGDESVVE